MLWGAARLIYALYDEYALLGSDAVDDVYAITLRAFMQLIQDVKLDVPNSKTCRKSDLDSLVIETDMSARRSEMLDTEFGLSRPELLQVLVGVAVRRHLETGQTGDVSEAVRRLLHEVIEPAMPRHVWDPPAVRGDPPLSDANELRRFACYSEAVTRRLEPHVPNCKILFGVYSGLRRRDTRKERKLLSLVEFVAIMEDTLPGWTESPCASRCGPSPRPAQTGPPRVPLCTPALARSPLPACVTL